MGTINLSLLTKRINCLFFIALSLAGCSQPATVESSNVANNVQSSPSYRDEQNNPTQLAQLQTDVCQPRTESSKTLDLGNNTATASDITSFFKSQDCPEILTRQVKKKTDLISTPKKLSMQINFEFNSARLTPTGKKALQPVGQALASSDLSNKRFVIEGHTDAKGLASYNLLLSKRRAQTVKNYLVNQFALDPARLRAVGKGSSELLNSAEPYAAENRRVVIALPR